MNGYDEPRVLILVLKEKGGPNLIIFAPVMAGLVLILVLKEKGGPLN